LETQHDKRPFQQNTQPEIVKERIKRMRKNNGRKHFQDITKDKGTR